MVGYIPKKVSLVECLVEIDANAVIRTDGKYFELYGME